MSSKSSPIKKVVNAVKDYHQAAMRLEPDHESAPVTEQWYVRQQLCLSISLGFSHFRRDAALEKLWRESEHGVVALAGLKNFQPGCTLKTFTLASIVKSIQGFADTHAREGSRTKLIMMAAIRESCIKSLDAWAKYAAYEKQLEEVRASEKLNGK